MITRWLSWHHHSRMIHGALTIQREKSVYLAGLLPSVFRIKLN